MEQPGMQQMPQPVAGQETTTQTNPAANFTPEQMQAYKTAFQAGQGVIYEQVRYNRIAEMAQQDPVSSLAGLIVKVLMMIEEKMGQLDMMVLIATGMSLLADLVEALQQSGDVQMSSDQITEAFGSAISMWLSQHPDRYSNSDRDWETN